MNFQRNIPSTTRTSTAMTLVILGLMLSSTGCFLEPESQGADQEVAKERTVQAEEAEPQSAAPDDWAVIVDEDGDSERPAGEIVVEVMRPRVEGTEVGLSMVIEGTAEIPADLHLWVFARRVDFSPFWWPQNEGYIDPETGQWRVQATFGGPQDVGWRFDIAVAVFDYKSHIQLANYLHRAVTSGHYPPIEMPKTAAPPKMLRVMKTSHH